MNEDFVTFDLAKKLKEKGFPQYTEKSYFVGDHKKRMCSVGTFLHVHTQNTEHLIAAPTISQVLKWLREEKGVSLNVYPSYFANLLYWTCDVISFIGEISIEKRLGGDVKTYEEAAIAGVEYCFDNLI